MPQKRLKERNAQAHAQHLADAVVKLIPKYAIYHANIYSWAYNSYIAGWEDRRTADLLERYAVPVEPEPVRKLHRYIAMIKVPHPRDASRTIEHVGGVIEAPFTMTDAEALQRCKEGEIVHHRDPERLNDARVVHEEFTDDRDHATD